MLAPPQRSMLFCFVSSDASNVSPWKITLLPYSAGGHGHGYLLLALYIRTCVFGEPDAKRQCVLLMCNLLSEKCIFWSTFVYMKYLWLPTSEADLRVFWKSASWVILLRSAQIKFSISSLDGLLIFFVNGGQASSTFVAISNKSNSRDWGNIFMNEIQVQKSLGIGLGVIWQVIQVENWTWWWLIGA